jgi:hypothetical protein
MSSMNARRPLDFKLWHAAAGLLAACLIATPLSAQSYAPYPYSYAPGGYAAFYGYSGQPYAAPGAAPAVYRRSPQFAGPYQAPYCPPGYRLPGDIPDPKPQRPSSPSDPQRPSRPGETPTDQSTDQRDTQPTQPSDQSPSDFTPSPESSGRATLTPGMNTPQLGRNDQSNRLNLFDNMAAAPQTRAWFGFQFAQTFDTALAGTTAFQSYIFTQNLMLASFGSATLHPDTVLALNENGVTSELFITDQSIYRVGAEWAPCSYFSVAVQGQYYVTSGANDPPDDWSNPQILLKTVLSQDFDSLLTATLGVTPEISTDFTDINERVTKIYPGMLFYEGLTPNWFSQGGFQFGVPVDGSNEVYSFDWSIALGWWAYRDPCAGRRSRCYRHPLRQLFDVTGIIPQVNVLGKHTVGDNRIIGPFGFKSFANSIIVPDGMGGTTVDMSSAAMLPEGFVGYFEPRSVVDVTFGGQVLLGDHIQVGLGYSIPVTSGSVRDDEFISTLTYLF